MKPLRSKSTQCSVGFRASFGALALVAAMVSLCVGGATSTGFQVNSQHNGLCDVEAPSEPLLSSVATLCHAHPSPLSSALATHGESYVLLTQSALLSYIEDQTWQYAFPHGPAAALAGVEISDSGRIYFSGTGDGSLRALDANGYKIWSFTPPNEYLRMPVLGPNGNVHVIGTSDAAPGRVVLHSVGASGKEAWQRDFQGEHTLWAPTIDTDGTIYTAMDTSVIALLPDGTPKWQVNVGGEPQRYLVADGRGTILCVTDSNEVVALDHRGKESWRFRAPEPYHLLSPPVLGRDSRLYVPASDGVPETGAWGTLALSDGHEVEWFFPALPMLVDEKGSLIAQTDLHGLEGEHAVYSLSPGGDPSWRVPLKADPVSRTVLSPWGSLLIPMRDRVLAISQDFREPMAEMVLEWLGDTPSATDIEAVKACLERRLSMLFRHYSARQSGDQIIAELPLDAVPGQVRQDVNLGDEGLHPLDPEVEEEGLVQLQRLLVTPGYLEFHRVLEAADADAPNLDGAPGGERLLDRKGNQYLVAPISLPDTPGICHADVRRSQSFHNAGAPVIALTLMSEAALELGRQIKDWDPGESIAIVLDDVVLSAQVLSESLLNALSENPLLLADAAQISVTGVTSMLDAERIARILESGPLPHALELKRFQVRDEMVGLGEEAETQAEAHSDEPAPVQPTETSFPEWRRDLQIGDVLLCRCADSPLFYAPRGPDLLEWTHCGLYVGEDQVVEALASGVSVSDISTWDYPSKTAVQAARVESASPDARQAAAAFAFEQVGRPYDSFYPLKSTEPDRDLPGWYGSELVWAAYKSAGDPLQEDLDLDPDSFGVTPDEIAKSPIVQTVGEHAEYRPSRDDLQMSFAFRVKSPVEIEVTDPDGMIVSSSRSEIAGAVYLTEDLDEDGHAEVTVAFPERKSGEYLIRPYRRPGADDEETYTLVTHDFASGNDSPIASDVRVRDIPADPYGVTFHAREGSSVVLLVVLLGGGVLVAALGIGFLIGRRKRSKTVT